MSQEEHRKDLRHPHCAVQYRTVAVVGRALEHCWNLGAFGPLVQEGRAPFSARARGDGPDSDGKDGRVRRSDRMPLSEDQVEEEPQSVLFFK